MVQKCLREEFVTRRVGSDRWLSCPDGRHCCRGPRIRQIEVEPHGHLLIFDFSNTHVLVDGANFQRVLKYCRTLF